MNPTRRKKQHRYRLSRPEDLGLVPLKYLKRKTPSQPTNYASGSPPSTPPPSSSPRGVVTSPPPRVLGLHMDETASPDPQLAKAEFIRLLIQKGLRIPRSDFVEDWKSTMLRAERYDAVKAVERCRRHWAIKSDWFGTPDLKAVIRDLAPNLVQKGCIQVVPVRDSSGRAVVCLHFQPKLYSSQEREIKKYLFYMLASVLEDIETQNKGISLVVWNTQDLESQFNNTALLMVSPTKFGGGIFDSFWSLWRSIRQAFKIDCLHYCTLNQSISQSSHSIVQESYDIDTMIRQYSASPHECLHAMLTFGVPVYALPILANQEGAPLDTTWHLGWADWRQKTDSYYLHVESPSDRLVGNNPNNQQHQHSPSRLILMPRSDDVLMGGYGSTGRVPPGNVTYHQLLHESLDEYMALTASTATRSTICCDIYHRITLNACQFLHPLDPINGILWEVMSQDLVLDRIQMALDYLVSQKEQAEKGGDDSSASTRRQRTATGRDHEWVEWLPHCCSVVWQGGNSSVQPSFCNWKTHPNMSSTSLGSVTSMKTSHF